MHKQLILFGSPGTGKSYQIDNEIAPELGIDKKKRDSNVIKTVFHPEYKYSDFMGKLLPLSSGNSIIYRYYPGHFLQTLGKAYRGIIENNGEYYLLVIDELNRGNAAAIFGSVFQLLDRDNDGWSSYGINISDMEMVGLLNSMDYEASINERGKISVDEIPFDKFIKELQKREKSHTNFNVDIVEDSLNQKKIYIPPNLSIVCTINTSDESIYYLDTAFKRRWDWKHIEAPSKSEITQFNKSGEASSDFEQIKDVVLEIHKKNGEVINYNWCECIVGINRFIKDCSPSIKRIEDKQIGYWFIKPENNKVTLDKIKDKLMFYLWDSVFARDKKPLITLLEDKLKKKSVRLATYTEFLQFTEELLKYWYNHAPGIKEPEQDSEEELEIDIPGF